MRPFCTRAYEPSDAIANLGVRPGVGELTRPGALNAIASTLPFRSHPGPAHPQKKTLLYNMTMRIVPRYYRLFIINLCNIL
jgi:hypothetical protein